MNCLNCGAPLELADGRSVLSCEYCQSTRQLQCDSDDGDRIISLDRLGDSNCPRCHEQLVQASLDGRRAEFCTHCHGVLLENAIFAEVTSSRRAAFRGSELAARPIDPELLMERIECPQCESLMDVHPNYGPGQAVIDSCSVCNLVWLDHSELTCIERTPGRRQASYDQGRA